MASSLRTGTSHGPEQVQANPLGGIRSNYPGPRAEISRDRNLAWWRRILPIIASHRLTFITAIALSFVSLVFQTLVPNMLNGAIHNVLTKNSGALHTDVVHILIVGVIAGITGIISRQYVYHTAYNVEADLRTLIYEHLTWLSFTFYDRVQSGQLISRANSDIRSVQMYSTFAPLIIVQCSIGVLAFGFMLSINVLLACIAMTIMPVLYFVGIRMRRVLFPISWITQARLADVATIVDQRRAGGEVLRPGRGRGESSRRRRRTGGVGVHQGRPNSWPVVALGAEPSPSRARSGPLLRRLDGAPWELGPWRHP